MPLPTSHSLLAATIVAATHPKTKNSYAIPMIIGVILANAADFDFALYWPEDLGFDFFVNTQWHRGFTHSILFSALVFAGIALIMGRDKLRVAVAYGLAYFSHVVLDYATTSKDSGLELFWFLSDVRYELGWFGLSEQPGFMSYVEIIYALGIEVLIFGPLLAVVIYLRSVVARNALPKN